jgi:hypothetical protein
MPATVRFDTLSAEQFSQVKDKRGVVLLAVNWNRRWNCGGFENAQLRKLGFDKLPGTKSTDDAAPDLVLDDAPLLFTKPGSDYYIFVAEPGEYAFSAFEIKAAKSVSDIGFFRGKRSQFIKDGKPLAGSFDVRAGEIVYIGHFFLSCHAGPVPWRYYLKDRAAFDEDLAKLKQKFPALDLDKAQYRLFETTEMGNKFSLP